MASITIYSEERLRGTKKTYSGKVEDVPSGENTCHSIKVDSGEFLVYSNNNYEGTSIRLPRGIYPDPGHIRNLHCGCNTNWNDQVRSLRPINQDGITLFDKDDFCGSEQVVTSNNPNIEMDNCCSIMVRGGWWKVFPYGDYNGEYEFCGRELVLGPGNYRMPIYAPTNGTISVGSVQKLECPY
ncbi:CRYGA [Branchiostoma lanceolatum]|uniref:CRYGA protein n=1 Tax=Branchiostoma lanceolatum TaxID=7740 RepID=A0A8J9ZWF3_BRALA|nr:CRYGA [Branchiostoma lanceolatum]